MKIATFAELKSGARTITILGNEVDRLITIDIPDSDDEITEVTPDIYWARTDNGWRLFVE